MTGLLHLADEILIEIASSLEEEEIMALRVTCSRLCAVASPFLFKTLYLSCHTPDLNMFREISANPVLLGGVEELIVDDTTISPVLMNEDVFYSMSRHENMWPKRRTPYFGNENWDDDDRVWSVEADREFYELLKLVYEGHEDNRVQQNDIAALRSALPGMRSLRVLVLTNRNADDTPESGAQSQFNRSPVAKMWRKLGERRRERPPFPPRVDWGATLQNDEFGGDEAFDMGYIFDTLDEYLHLNQENGLNGASRVQEVTDDDEQAADNNGQPHEDDNAVFSDDDSNERSDHADGTDLSLDATGNDSDQAEEAVPDQTGPALPGHNTFLPVGIRALRREGRGLNIVTEILRDANVQSRLRDFRIDASLDTLSDEETPGLSMRLFDFLAPPFSLRLSMAFSVMIVTRFELVLSNGLDEARGQEILDEGQVGSILAAMKSLKHLVIEAHGMGVIGVIPHGTTFPNLRTAEFSCGLVSRLEIRRFLRQHGTTLKDFRLLYCSVDNDDPSWSDIVQDIRRLQDMGTTNLRTAVLVSGYESIPLTGCGRNQSKTPPEADEDVYSWTLGLHEDVIECPVEDLGHIPPQELPQP